VLPKGFHRIRHYGLLAIAPSPPVLFVLAGRKAKVNRARRDCSPVPPPVVEVERLKR